MTFANSLLLIKQDSFITKEYYMWNSSLKHEIFIKLEVIVRLPCTEACANVLWNRTMKMKVKMRTMRKIFMSIINIRLAFLKFMWFSPSFFNTLL